MIVTIWRHGEAGSAVSDRLRKLTARGRDEVRRGARQFRGACAGAAIALPDLVLFSRWVRTTQTADILGAAFAGAAVREQAQLQPGSGLGAVDAGLAELAAAGRPPAHVVLVSHQPLVSGLVDYYLGGLAAGAAGQVPALSPGGLATLSLQVVARDCGQLLFWALPPAYEVAR